MRRPTIAVFAIAAVLFVALPDGPARADTGSTMPTGPTVALAAVGREAQGTGFYRLTGVPGAVYDLPFVLTNPTDSPVDATVYAADAATADGGGMRVLPPTAPRTQTGAWLQPADSAQDQTLHLAPREKRPIVYRLAVPSQAAPGQHVGVVVATVRSEATSDNQPTGDKQLGFKLNIEHNVAIGVEVTVPGSIQHHLTPAGVTHQAQYDGHVLLRALVHNDGNVVEHPAMTVTITGPNGTVLADDKMKMGSLYPGTDGAVLENAPAAMTSRGRYTVRVAVTNTDGAVTTGEYQVDLTRQEADQVAATQVAMVRSERQTDHVVVMSKTDLLYIGLGALALLVVAVVAIIFVLMRMRRRLPERPSDRAAGDTEDSEAS